MTEKEKMLADELYDAADPQLVAERRRARDPLHALNGSRDGQRELRMDLRCRLLGARTGGE
jgi:maltose O-acetyltransferase